MSTDEAVPQSTPEMILACIKAGGALADSVTEKWVTEDETGEQFMFHDGKILCWNPHTVSLYEWNTDEKRKFISKQGEKVCRLTVISDSRKRGVARIEEPQASAQAEDPSALSEASSSESETQSRDNKRRKTNSDDQTFLVEAEIRNPGITAFGLKWGLKVEYLRRLNKLDGMLVDHVFRAFNPHKSKPKNALKKFTDALLRYPQKWRLQGMVEQGFADTDEYVKLNEGQSCSVGSDFEACELLILDTAASAVQFDVVCLEGDFYLQSRPGSSHTFLNGLRVSPEDGPVQLTDLVVVKVGETMILVEIGDEGWLDQRRKKWELITE